MLQIAIIYFICLFLLPNMKYLNKGGEIGSPKFISRRSVDTDFLDVVMKKNKNLARLK